MLKLESISVVVLLLAYHFIPHQFLVQCFVEFCPLHRTIMSKRNVELSSTDEDIILSITLTGTYNQRTL